MRLTAALGMAALVGFPAAGGAMSLEEAIAQAQRSNPSMAEARAGADGADARLARARAGRLPTVVVSGQGGWGTTDLGGFFGFGRSNVTPRGASIDVRQPIFSGGGVTAAIDRARDGRDAALVRVAGAKALLSAQVAEAYVTVLSAVELRGLHEAQIRQMTRIAEQAELTFKDGETPRTDLDQSHARLAEARAGLARAEGDVARARAHFETVVGAPADSLEPPPPAPSTPVSLDDAVAGAARSSPTLSAAEASVRAAEAGVRYAQADRLPTLALDAKASSVRDQFFPGYRSDGVTVGIEGRWTLYSGGLVNGRVSEARAEVRAARAALEAARAEVREAVVGAWADIETARALAQAATDRSAASASALDSVRNEVRVGQKPTLALLDAEREALAAGAALVAARGEQVVDAWRLTALLGGESPRDPDASKGAP